jgi:fructose-1-phosphate kinase PfkB-like protein
LIKPNQDELEALCGFAVSSDEDVVRAIESLDQYQVEVIAVSLGKRGAITRIGNEYYKSVPPAVEVGSTAGCGDSFLAALLCGYEKNMPYHEMLKLATAVSSATAASLLSVGYDLELAESLIEKSVVTRIQ